MKFWKSLNNLIEETLPDWRDKFLSYKDLKKRLKRIYPKEGGGESSRKRPRVEDRGAGSVAANEEEVVDEFVRGLENEVEKFNSFFVDKEEEYVIKWKELQEMMEEAKDSPDELVRVGREIVDLHGEMVLLENYSALNYTGIVKILKKYDKRSGTLIRLPFIQKVLQEPFFSMDVLNQLVNECESVLVRQFFSNNSQPASAHETASLDANQGQQGPSGLDPVTETNERPVPDANESAEINHSANRRPLEVPSELSEIKSMESMYGKLTLSALRVLKEIRSGSSTVSEFSLPPLQTNLGRGLDEGSPGAGTSGQAVSALS
uniref:SPX domain-containing protein n=1 Tax=Kalanchoe fedtschenkoi TaxID=63787 RepID=A0A7N1A0I8_KALFE